MAKAVTGGGTGRPSLFLIDGTYTVFRSFFAIGRLTAPDGTPTSGVFGLVNTVRKIVRDHAPDHLAVAFDLEGPTHRDEVFEAYKANRPEPPPELVPQFPLAVEACAALRWPDVSAQGFEADDVIATLAREARGAGLDVVIVTSDKDLYQLVGDGVVVLNPAKDDRILDADGVEDVFGVRPEQVVDVLALMGDAVDNVPGVPGVGEKTAKALVARYGGVDEIARRAEAFRAAWRAREAALEALEAEQEGALEEALERLSRAAGEIAALERELGGEAGEDLAARFGEAAGLAASWQEAKPRAIKKALKGIEKKTQPKTWLAIAENDDQLQLSRRLVTVSLDAPVTLDLEAMRIGPPDAEAAAALFHRLGFRRLTQEMEEEAGAAAETVAASIDAVVVATETELVDAVRALAGRPAVAVDTETDGLDPRKARLVGVSLAGDSGGGIYVPVGHRDGAGIAWEAARPLLADLLENASVPKVGQNLKYDRAVLRKAGIELQGIACDTLVASQLLDPGRTSSHKLDDLAQRYLGERMVPYEEVARKDGEEVTLDLVDVETVARYAVEDAVVALRLADVLRDELAALDLVELFETIEMPLLPVLEEMEHVGIRLDTPLLEALSARLETQLEGLVEEIHGLAGHPFNINSPQQLRTVLFDELELRPTGRRTQKTRKHSTGQESLEALSSLHPLPTKVLEYRELSKLKSTYVDALPRLVDPGDGRIHGQFHQLGAATGRLSSSDPNLQNIPVRTEQGRKIREAFVPEPGWSFVSADYSQMELRILAHLSDDPELIDAFEQDLDIHRHTAALVAGVPIASIDDAARARAKAVNFGIIYGMSEFRLAREQGMSRDEARRFIDAYFERFAAVKAYIDGVIRDVQKTGEVRTLYGRVRRFPELAGGGAGAGPRLSRPAREQLLRQAVNTTVQGTGADIVKRAMARVARRLRLERLETRLLLQVHDELLLEAPPAEVEAAGALVREEMEGAARLSVRLKVDVRSAGNWADAH